MGFLKQLSRIGKKSKNPSAGRPVERKTVLMGLEELRLSCVGITL
jgi:hypothetical protein